MEVIGLTGNIGSGKSTVGKILAGFGAVVIDCDVVSRQLVAPGMPCLRKIIDQWGEAYLLPDGNLDRKKMADNIFSHKEEKERLERILHPAIKGEVQQQIEENRSKGAVCVVVEAPLLIEAGFTDFVDTVWLVMSKREDVLARLASYRGYSLQQAEAALANQMPDTEKIPYADVVIENSGDLEALKIKVAEAWQRCAISK